MKYCKHCKHCKHCKIIKAKKNNNIIIYEYNYIIGYLNINIL
uniref:Uncharacterized protein n=1 Tax=viral metagenome TaxID=1070528 RepID=A0A6C0DHR5_9ZZZZ